jgi:hypothetical protein
MSRRVVISDRIIIDKRVPIPGLRPLRGGGDNGIELGKAVKIRIIPACVEEVNSEAGFLALTREFVLCAQVAERVALFRRFFSRSISSSNRGISCLAQATKS